MNVDGVLIAGPTASGKSAAALELAERLGGVIVNADSMQVYRELRVLTARPSRGEEGRAPHRLYGHVGAVERYSAGRFQADAAEAIAEARAEKRVPIFVGGTGLYFDVLEEGLSPIPPVPAEVRTNVRRRFDALGREAFFAELASRDPKGAAALKASDTQRVLRAADVLEATGHSLSWWQSMSGKSLLADLSIARFVIAPPREILFERIDRRFAAMLADGALEEARGLQGLDPSLPLAKALGLRELWRHLAGELTLERATAETQLATRRYVKRQMTWFRNRMKDWKWLEYEEISNLITYTWHELS
jgi:tRNA dimethylallyltransferase